MNMQHYIRTLGLGIGLGMAGLLHAAPPPPMNLAQQPLFLNQSVDANVFFEMDDSGSMDFEIMTQPYYLACAYDVDHGGGCSSPYIDTGDFQAYDGSRWRNFTYVFNNETSLWNDNDWSATESLGYRSGLDNVWNNDWRVWSSSFNTLFFNPFLAPNYAPWPTATVGSTSFTAARGHPLDGKPGYKELRNLTCPNADISGFTGAMVSCGTNTGFVFAIALDTHGYSGTEPQNGTSINRTDKPNGKVDLWDEHYRYRVKSSCTTVGCAGTITVEVDYIYYEPDANGHLNQQIKSLPSFSGATVDPYITGLTADQLAQGVANWYTFFRKRYYVTNFMVGAVVMGNRGLRYGLGFINQNPSSSAYSSTGSQDGYSTGGNTLPRRVDLPTAAPYATHNQKLLNTLYYSEINGGTPLRSGALDVVDYFNDSSSSSPIKFSCQHNFALLVTDGYYNNGDTSGIGGDNDGDGKDNLLSDIAWKWGVNNPNVDLNTNLENRVPVKDNQGTTVQKPQHLVWFPVSFGIEGLLKDTDNDKWPNETQAGVAFSPVINPVQKGITDVIKSASWQASGVNEGGAQEQPEKIDDMWHMAYNSDGEFVSAKDPIGLLAGLSSIFSNIANVTSSAAALAANSGRVCTDVVLYQAKFNSQDWTGNLLAVNLDPKTGAVDKILWETEDTLDAQTPNTRSIITYNPSSKRGIPFRFPADYRTPTATEMTSAQVSSIMTGSTYPLTTAVATEIAENQDFGEDTVDFLRGSVANEVGAGGSSRGWRPRKHKMADVINSAPEYVGPPHQVFPNSIATSPYSSFVKAKASRKPMIYVGANGGMLHGFDAANGKEEIAYVPSKVYPNLPELKKWNYGHKFFVNGQINVMDVYDSTFPVSDKNWASVLVAGLGQGGQGLFALNVTNPGSFSELAANKIAMWEFTEANDADLGYVMGQLPVAKLNNGDWGVIVSNGYNNTEPDGTVGNGSAVLYVINAVTGALIKKIDTGAVGTTKANGLSSPVAVDEDGDFDIDYVYAGDLLGNLWRFTLKDSQTSKWGVSYGGDPYFTTDAGQPITVQPQVSRSAQGGFMIFFGTGQYLEVGDNIITTSYPTQAFYGIWDPNGKETGFKTLTSSDLLAQQITEEFSTTVKDKDGNSFPAKLRLTTNDVPDYNGSGANLDMGWYLPLLVKGKTATATLPANRGERVVTDALLVSDGSRIVFVTWLPTTDPCEAGGTGWLMELNAQTGQRLTEAPLDLNKDGAFDALDSTYYGNTSNSGTVFSGWQSESGGLPQTPTVTGSSQSAGGGCLTEDKNMSDSTGGIIRASESAECAVGRLSWRYLN